jgi:hypothetical protein
MVHPQRGGGKYLLLDGHRLQDTMVRAYLDRASLEFPIDASTSGFDAFYGES